MKDENNIARTLMKLGNSPKNKGFHYLKAAIELCLPDRSAVTNLSRQLYPRLAERFSTSEKAVERAMRCSIHSGWHRRDAEFADEIFGNLLQSLADIPTNGLYISAVAEWLSGGCENSVQ